MDLERVFGTATPIIGMVHPPPLPGAPQSGNDLGSVIDRERVASLVEAAGGTR